MRAISLFSGVGMFDLGVSLAGFDIIAQVEIDDYCREVLKRHAPTHWPNAVRHVDVRAFGRHDVSGPVDLIFGGFPCQPFSAAGKRQGASDSRNLWPEFCRIIGELRPRAVMLENIPSITQAHTVEDEVQPAYALTVIADLATLGYDAQWGIISAADAGAPHQRNRWWCVAYANGDGRQRPSAWQRSPHTKRYYSSHQCGRRAVIHATEPGGKAMADAKDTGRQVRRYKRIAPQNTKSNKHSKVMHNAAGRRSAQSRQSRRPINTTPRRYREIHRLKYAGNRRTQPRMGGAAHGITAWVDSTRWPAYQGQGQHAWESPRTTTTLEAKERRARVQALGNGGIWWIAYHLAAGIWQELRR